jgi:glycosyltransferase involved in cell wall biosynthesis
VLGAEGIEVVALEVASRDDVYAWRPERGETPFRRETLFPDLNYDELGPEEMHRAVCDALDRINPDAVDIHSYSTPDARACLAWCRQRGRVAICMAESREGDAPRTWWREAMKRELVSQFDAAQTSGTLSARYAVKLGLPADRIFAGYSVVDNDYFDTRARQIRDDPGAVRFLPGLDSDVPFFFASARFITRKDLSTLIRAYAGYRESSILTPWNLVLLGDGPLRSTIESLIRELRVEGVVLAGWQQIDVIPAYYALAAAFVHTALVDQWGLVVNEAMASGLPVVVSTGAGCAIDLVREGENGYTFAPGDPLTLAQRLESIATSDRLRQMGEASREIIAQWPLRRFGTSLLAAARAGEASAARGLSPRAAFLIWAMKRLAAGPRSFHAVES